MDTPTRIKTQDLHVFADSPKPAQNFDEAKTFCEVEKDTLMHANIFADGREP
jgi:hypothetical protein